MALFKAIEDMRASMNQQIKEAVEFMGKQMVNEIQTQVTSQVKGAVSQIDIPKIEGLDNIFGKISSLKGDQGDQGDQGNSVKGDKGERGPEGVKGGAGMPGGPGMQGMMGEKGKSGAKGEKGKQGDKGESGTEIQPPELAHKLNATENSIQMKVIIGLEEQFNSLKQKISSAKKGRYMSGSGGDPGDGLSLLAVTGTIDDSNISFTTASVTAKIVFVNGAGYQNGSGVTISGTTITLDNPVGTNNSIYALG